MSYREQMQVLKDTDFTFIFASGYFLELIGSFEKDFINKSIWKMWRLPIYYIDYTVQIQLLWSTIYLKYDIARIFRQEWIKWKTAVNICCELSLFSQQGLVHTGSMH